MSILRRYVKLFPLPSITLSGHEGITDEDILAFEGQQCRYFCHSRDTKHTCERFVRDSSHVVTYSWEGERMVEAFPSGVESCEERKKTWSQWFQLARVVTADSVSQPTEGNGKRKWECSDLTGFVVTHIRYKQMRIHYLEADKIVSIRTFHTTENRANYGIEEEDAILLDPGTGDRRCQHIENMDFADNPYEQSLRLYLDTMFDRLFCPANTDLLSQTGSTVNNAPTAFRGLNEGLLAHSASYHPAECDICSVSMPFHSAVPKTPSGSQVSLVSRHVPEPANRSDVFPLESNTISCPTTVDEDETVASASTLPTPEMVGNPTSQLPLISNDSNGDQSRPKEVHDTRLSTGTTSNCVIRPPSSKPTPRNARRNLHGSIFLTTLKNCKPNTRCNILCVVTQINPIQDIKLTKGKCAGQVVRMASILVSDNDVPFFPITLWREHSVWADRLEVGDVLQLGEIDIRVYRGKISGTTVFRSACKVLHRLCRDTPIYDETSEPGEAYHYDSIERLLRWASRQPLLRFHRFGLVQAPQQLAALLDHEDGQRERADDLTVPVVRFSSPGDLISGRFSGVALVKAQASLISFPRLQLSVPPKSISDISYDSKLVTCYCRTCGSEATQEGLNHIWRCPRCFVTDQDLAWTFQKAVLNLVDAADATKALIQAGIGFGILEEMFANMVSPRLLADKAASDRRKKKVWDRLMRLCHALTNPSSAQCISMRLKVQTSEDAHGFVINRQVDVLRVELFGDGGSDSAI
ncbi:uncharacterized protein SPPG_06288 [Spizellomyces punctatus DAOM BR117]|uniref:Shieldin complex subunit 2 first OB fold domain-containing protein n=1 Tax=Spizellomyces punctatus (strain DAOM BR117) TaxID=645134 RepID=A0A0L0HBQ0_SPIPD|nr:uncharacterized protein SPPG_06288 [Spizellomyces punctatus DAOM BR117]KNC98607.1 hypothetical protein SPPG_06288 [Spizellomyces punctatus DAOM BR117]|eukprot:XP_016606647.1 hypothetical protein SPPG_06288 [Spizellomyces punctatus DAOM BR117]